MRRKRQTREEQKAATRAALIEAAGKVFGARGYHDASVEEIADEAGYSHGAVYSNFSGKEELFLALYEEYIAWRVREIRASHSTETDLASSARAAADQWMERLREDPEYFLLALEFTVYAARRPAVRADFASRHGAVREAVAQLYEQHAEAGGLELPFPASELGLVAQALGAGLARERMSDPDAVREGLYGDFLAWMFAAMRDPR